MSETWADAQFDMLEAAYDEVPIWAKRRIAELTVERDAYFEMVKRVQADCDACDELIRDLWSGFECGVAKVCDSCPSDAKLGYVPCAIEERMRRLGIEVDE